ncbi:MAG: response regulator [Methylococcales bacterium]|nr:response regulator [Methylococcales bacterium]
MKKIILLCDDDKGLNNDIKDVLEREFSNIEIVQAYDRETALDFVSKRYFSIAIVDLNLEGNLPPGDWSKTGGVEIVNKIIENNFDTKFIVVSANPETELSFNLAKLGVSSYIQKGEMGGAKKILECTASLLKSDDDMVKNLPYKMVSFAGKKGFDKEIWEDNSISLLSIKGGAGGLESIAKKVLNKFYPYKYLTKEGLLLDKENKYLHGEIWSYRLGKPLNLFIYNKKVSNIDNIVHQENEKTDELMDNIFIVSQPTDSLIKIFDGN